MRDSPQRRPFNLVNPHFFQPLLPGFLSTFRIPKSFLKYIVKGEDEKDEKIAILRDINGKIWQVKVADDRRHFKDGWEKFCKDHDLKVGDFLVFKFQANLVFDVSIFDPSTSCERLFPRFDSPSKVKFASPNDLITSNGIPKNEKGSKKNRDHKACFAAKVAFKPRGYPYFCTDVKPYCLKWNGMPISTKFARENGLAGRWCEIKLIDEKGKSWQLPLKHMRTLYSTAYIGGWRPFHEANALKTGDPVIFELLDSTEKPVMKFYKLS